MDVKTGEIDQAMEGIYGASISQDEVSSLLQEIQGEQGIAAGGSMAGVGTGQVSGNAAQNANDVDELQAKMDQLKNL